MACYKSSELPSGFTTTGRASYKTQAECLQNCKEGSCCEGETCSVKPECQCQGTGKVFGGVGSTCTPCEGFMAFDGSGRKFKRLGVYDLDCCYLGEFRPDDGYYVLEKKCGKCVVVDSARWYAARGWAIGATVSCVSPRPIYNTKNSATWISLLKEATCCNPSGDLIYATLSEELDGPCASGGCCYPNGCGKLSREACAAIGGRYLGDGVACDVSVCCPDEWNPAFKSKCCTNRPGAWSALDGSVIGYKCYSLSRADCATVGGVWSCGSACSTGERPPVDEVGEYGSCGGPAGNPLP